MAKKNIIDKVTDDSTKIVITNKSVKWIIGILTTGVVGILGLAWGLYVSVSSDLETTETNIKQEMTSNQKAVMDKLKDLKDAEVKPNTQKNHDQDLDIVRLLERTNSRHESINGNSERPATTNNPSELPSIGN